MLIEDDEILYVLKAPLAVGEVHIMHNPIAVLALVLSTSLLLRAISEHNTGIVVCSLAPSLISRLTLSSTLLHCRQVSPSTIGLHGEGMVCGHHSCVSSFLGKVNTALLVLYSSVGTGSSLIVPQNWSRLHLRRPPTKGMLAFVCALKNQKRRILRPTSTMMGSRGAWSAVVSNCGCKQSFHARFASFVRSCEPEASVLVSVFSHWISRSRMTVVVSGAGCDV